MSENGRESTGRRVLEELKRRSPDYFEDEGEGRYRLNNPFRPGSDSEGFCLLIDPDGEHGTFYNHGPGNEEGSLYELAERLGLLTRVNGDGNRPKKSKHIYTGLEEYAQEHGTNLAAFKAAGWHEARRFCGTHKKERPALVFPTKNGERWRYTDGLKPEYGHKRPYTKCWYGLERAADLARQQERPLVICNGEASTVAAQAHGVAACCVTTGSEVKDLPDNLLAELKNIWQGDIVTAFDCDKTGRENGPALAIWLKERGYSARAINLNLGYDGEDLADFCKLHQADSAAALQKCADLDSPKKQDDKPRRKTSKDYLAALETLGYSFRMNACNDRLEVNQEPISDAIRATIRTRMRDIGYHRHITAVEDAYLAHAYKNQYHPVKDYLEGLEWDGYPHIAELAAYFSDVDNVFGKWLTKWLVGTIAKVFKAEQNSMLVLDGPQGIGKSYFAAWLGSPLPDYFIEAPINPENKDDDVRLISKWLWEVAELGATTRRADRDALKFFLTKRTVTVRKPYGRDDIVKPAMASMVGTINNEAGFLNDPTGDRRFLVCELTDINWDYAKIDPNQIWAEAYQEYKNGYNWKLTKAEAIKRSEINSRYRIDSHVTGLFLKYFGYTTDPTNPRFNEWISSTDILEALAAYGLGGNHRANLMELSAGLKELGITKKRQGQTGFLGVWRK